MADRPDYAREIRYELVDAAAICERLGLLAGHGTFLRQAGGVIIRCPWHEDRSPSCSVRRGPDGTLAVKCHGCQQGGDVLSLIAVVHGLNTKSDFRTVLRTAAELAGMWQLVGELDGGEVATGRREIVPPTPEPERTYPPIGEVTAVWESAVPADSDAAAAAYLSGRSLDPETVASSDLARVLSAEVTLPRWAAYQRESWVKTGHRLIVPMWSSDGAMTSVRAIRITEGDSPKRLPPGGHRATALAMADEVGLAMLRGTYRPERIVIAEGEPDWLSWATARRTGPVAAVLGIVTGSWTPAIAAKVPDGCDVIVWTDHDRAGDAYAAAIRASLKTRCFVRRGGRR